MLDVGLPGMSGFEVLRRIRQTSDVPVVTLTAAADEMDHVRGLELGVHAGLRLPPGPRIRALVDRLGSAAQHLEADEHERVPEPATTR